MVPGAPLGQTEAGLVPVGEGWFVLNARAGRWNARPGRHGLTLTGSTELEAETYSAQLGVNLAVIEPGEPSPMYHWETEQRHGASPDEDTQDTEVVYAHVPSSEPSASCDGWLPSE